MYDQVKHDINVTQILHLPYYIIIKNSYRVSNSAETKTCTFIKTVLSFFGSLFFFFFFYYLMIIPTYDQLPINPKYPKGTAWGVWGDDDNIGTVNLLTPERVLNVSYFFLSFFCLYTYLFFCTL